MSEKRFASAIGISEHDHGQDSAYDQHPRDVIGAVPLEKCRIHIVAEDRGHKEDSKEDHREPCEPLRPRARRFSDVFPGNVSCNHSVLISFRIRR